MKTIKFHILRRLILSPVPWCLLVMFGLSLMAALAGTQSQVVSAEDPGAPQVHSIIPDCGYPTQTVNFTIRGVNLPVGEGVVVSLVGNTDVVCRNCYVSDNSTISGQMDIGQEAPLGWYDLEVLLGSEKTNITSGAPRFHVQPMPNPTLTSVEPGNLKQGETQTITIIGKGFPKGASATIVFAGGSGIMPVIGQADEWNTITADVKVAKDADLGSRDVIVSFIEPQVAVAPLEHAFEVRKAAWSDLGLVFIALSACLGGIVSGLLGWIDSEKGFRNWDWGKFARTLVVSVIAGVGFAVGFQLVGSLQIYHFFVAFLGGAGGDALSSRFVGATEASKGRSAPSPRTATA